MRFCLRLTVVIAAAFLCACPYEFGAPLVDPRPNSIDDRLLGTWSISSSKETSIVDIKRFNSSEYLIQSLGSEGNRVAVESFRGYLVAVCDQQLLQINAVGGDPGYLLAKFAIDSKGTVTVRFIAEKAVPAELKSNPKRIADYLKTHLNDSVVYESDTAMVLTRIGGAPNQK